MMKFLKKMKYNTMLLILLSVLLVVMMIHVFVAGCGTHEAMSNKKMKKFIESAREATKKSKSDEDENKNKKEEQEKEKSVAKDVKKMSNIFKRMTNVMGDLEDKVPADEE